MGVTSALLGPLERANPNHWTISFSEDMFGKTEDKFLRSRSWGRQDSSLLNIENGELTNMNLFLLITGFSK
jgi:hypothetical protein